MYFLVKAYIGLGSNTENKEKNILRAIDILSQRFDVTNKSSIYETEPVGTLADGEWFMNSVLEIETELTAPELLEKLIQIENQFGRQRIIKYGKISLDLDLLFHGDKVIERFDIHVPHHKIADRCFVLKPMAEIAPDFVHPVTQLTMKQMLKDAPKDKAVNKCRIKL
ncbi:2-amino-4-hydroxy-6-hydroxymethyldihydropteridine diphosphokinase [Candidatus Woesearchaeota archaeon]|nr:2-amino-4-hydroxy-6-hydroxymethyldihydropteridine diphosphokinase [Candidatus Woesearchaeota archaeon]